MTEILKLTNLLITEEKLINQYSMSDPRLKPNIKNLLSSFSVRVFKNLMPMIMTILKKMKTECYFEKEICLSNGPTDLFKLLSQVTEMYRNAPHREVIVECLGLCSK